MDYKLKFILQLILILIVSVGNNGVIYKYM